MACRCGGTFLTPILAVAALAVAGAGGYKLISGCGTCSDTSTPAALVSTTTDTKASCGLCPSEAAELSAGVQTVSATESHGTCTEGSAAKACSETAVAAKPDGCCPSKAEATVKTVAAKPDGCCKAKGEASVTTVAATEETKACKQGADGCTGDGTNGCCGGCKDQQKSEEKKADGVVATSGK